MKISRLIFALTVASLCLAADFDFDIDLSRLQPSGDTPQEDRRIFENLELLPDLLREKVLVPGRIEEIHLPAGAMLVVGNTPSLPAAYELLARALKTEGVEGNGPVTILLHADNQVSAGIPVQISESHPLPLGTDLAHLPERKFLLTPLRLEMASRNDAELAQAVARIRRDALERGKKVDTRELYLFPQQDGAVLLGLLTP